MPANAAARRYAQAVFDIAIEQNTLTVWDVDLRISQAAVSRGARHSRADSVDQHELGSRRESVEFGAGGGNFHGGDSLRGSPDAMGPVAAVWDQLLH